jgi:hypothetical protein
VYLELPDTLPSKQYPLVLDTVNKVNKASLVILMWLQKYRDVTNAREVLQGRVKYYIALLSNNNILNNQQVFMTLFKTFMADLDSREDHHIALHLLKDAEEHVVGRYDAVGQP